MLLHIGTTVTVVTSTLVYPVVVAVSDLCVSVLFGPDVPLTLDDTQGVGDAVPVQDVMLVGQIVISLTVTVQE